MGILERPLSCKHLITFLVLLFSMFFSSCTDISIKGEGQKKFGVDSNYFIGLKLLQEGNESEAAQKFNICIKKGSYYCAMKSAQNLCTLGSVQDKNAACLKLLKDFPEPENILLAVRQLYSAEEISKVIEITQNCDITTCNNELVMLRLKSMRKRGDAAYLDTVFEWFTKRQISQFHYNFFTEYIYVEPELEKSQQAIIDAKNIDDLFSTDFYDGLENEGEGSLTGASASLGLGTSEGSPKAASHTNSSALPEPSQNRIEADFTQEQLDTLNLRILVYKRSYSPALELAKAKLQTVQNEPGVLLPQLCSDIGKSFLYGSQNFLQNADYFRGLAKKAGSSDSAHYFWFYAGRFYDKVNNHKTMAENCFLNAANTATTPSQKDNALWYYLNTASKDSASQFFSVIENCSRQWSDSYYFDDFFGSFAPILLASGSFDSFGTLYKILDGYASEETISQYAYIYARLIEEGLVKADENTRLQALQRALKSGHSFYYTFLSACKLGYSHNQIESYISSHYARKQPSEYNKQKSEAAEKLLTGYATFGFPQMIFPEYNKLYSVGISAETAFYLCDFLQRCGLENNAYFVQGIRLAAKACEQTDRELTPQDLKYLFPKGFEEYVSSAAQEYNLEPQILYALIRTESFFNVSAVSHAGAIGLTQLMPTTAGDIARRLKKPDYQLDDAETNITFGSYYFSELVRRCNGDYLSAVFSYNAGITRVRKWLNSSLIGFNKKSEMPKDLFLETVPFTETRDYGKKVFSAAIMYDVLYKNSSDISSLFF